MAWGVSYPGVVYTIYDCILGEGLKTARMRAHEHRVTLVLGRVHLCSESRDATRRYSLLLV